MNKSILYLAKKKSKVYLRSRILKNKYINVFGAINFAYIGNLYSFFSSYHKGMFDLYYYGKVVFISKKLLSLKIKVRRIGDKSVVSLFLNSPFLLNIFFFYDKR
jgi:hypothetical protein